MEMIPTSRTPHRRSRLEPDTDLDSVSLTMIHETAPLYRVESQTPSHIMVSALYWSVLMHPRTAFGRIQDGAVLVLLQVDVGTLQA